MTDRTAEKGAIQYAIENPSAPVSRIGGAGYIQGVANDLATGRLTATTSTLAGRGALIAKIANSPSLLFDFTDSATAKIGSATLTYTGQNGTLFNSSGTLTAATTNVPRLDYNPSTLVARGLLIEEARTNSIRNNTMVGAVAGSPGTRPTNWQIAGAGLGTLTQTISNVTTTNGISTFDVRLSGTTSTVSYGFRWETDTQIAASNGQVWANSFYVAKVAGATTNITSINPYIEERTGAGTFITSGNGSDLASSLTTTLTRAEYVRTLSGGGTVAVVNGGIILVFASGVAIDITLRIGMPQLELGAFATSVISTSSAAVTRTADIASITGASFSSFWNATQGTIVARYMLAKAANGSNQFVARASDNTYNNSIALNTLGGGFASMATASGGVFDGVASSVAALTDNVFSTVAGSYSSSGISISKDGAAVVSDNTLTFPTGMTRLDIGGDHAGANHFGSGWISSLAYYTTRKTDSQLQALST